MRLPPEIGQLTALTKLGLEHNALSAHYLSLIAAGQPAATVNVLAFLRAEQGWRARVMCLFRRFLGWT